jgi:RimJ/RimL family protein N-acetyltransferase
MSSAYGKIQKPTSTSSSLSSFLPYITTLPTINNPVTLTSITLNSPSSSLISHMHNVFNEIVKEGNTYPQEFPLSLEEFINYFLSYDAFIVLSDEGIKKLKKIEESKIDDDIWNEEFLGMFYVKPNYPGRCSHVCNLDIISRFYFKILTKTNHFQQKICNAGFVVPKQHRDKQIGKLMAQSYLKIAPLLGYKSSVFNLVFENNTASIKLWKKLGFKEVGRIPNAGRLKKINSEEEEFVDAIMFYYNFEKEN